MENICRIIILVIFLSCASESQSASILGRRFMSSPSGSGDMSTGLEELTNPEPALDSSSAELILDLTDDKEQAGHSSRNSIQGKESPLGSLLRRSVDARRSIWGRHEPREESPHHIPRNYKNASQGNDSEDGFWTMFNSRHDEDKSEEHNPIPRSQPQFFDEEFHLQNVKRSPACLRKCIAQGLLHPAQCHSLC